MIKKNVLGEDVPGAPVSTPPYFTDEMFTIIRRIKESSSLNIITMKEKDWTRLFPEDYIIMETGPTDSRRFLPSISELASPSTNWDLSKSPSSKNSSTVTRMM